MIRALETDELEEEEEQEDEDQEEETPETEMGLSIRAAVRTAIKSLPKKEAKRVIADLHGKGF